MCTTLESLDTFGWNVPPGQGSNSLPPLGTDKNSLPPRAQTTVKYPWVARKGGGASLSFD